MGRPACPLLPREEDRSSHSTVVVHLLTSACDSSRTGWLGRREAADSSMFRKTKMVCTIGPTSCSRENLFRLADTVCAPLAAAMLA